MMDPPPPDPYAALNVPRDASSATIKSAYRKLALKYHPDKAKDKGEEFHRVQQAYELIGEDDARRKYDDQVRLTDLRKDLFARRGSAGGHGPNSPIRTTDGRNRSSSNAGFEARGAPRYEERRPPKQYQTSGPAPRAAYAEEEAFDAYFSHRTAPRKQDGYDGSTRRQASTRSPPPKPAPRAETTREALKKEKANSMKSRNDKKKQKTQENDRERRGKFSSMASLDSGDSDEGYYEESRRRNSEYEQDRIRKENTRGIYEDPRSQKFQRQTSHITEYINRSKTEGLPIERDSPPPPPVPQQYPSENIPQEIPLRSRPATANEPQYEIREPNRDSRATPTVRKAAAKFKEKGSSSPRNSKSESRNKPSGSASPEPHKAERKPPTLQTTNSSPANFKNSKSRSTDDYNSRSADVPRTERATTTTPIVPPAKRGSVRKDNTMPAVSSGLRHHAETYDSGYNTSSPSETPNVPLPTSKTYQYGEESVQVESGDDYGNMFKDPDRFRRTPSPLHEPDPRDRNRERDRDYERRGSAPRDHPRPRDRDRDRDRERERDSAPRSASYQNASTARDNLEPERPSQSSSRRPSMPQRTSSSRTPQSSGRTPTLNRGTSSPIPTPIRTGNIPTQSQGYFFGEIPRTTSPDEFYIPNYDGSGSGPTVGKADERGYSRRFPQADISYAQYPSGGSGYYSGGSRAEMANAASGQPRRGSEDIGAKARAEAFACMAPNTRERPASSAAPGIKRGSTFVY